MDELCGRATHMMGHSPICGGQSAEILSGCPHTCPAGVNTESQGRTRLGCREGPGLCLTVSDSTLWSQEPGIGFCWPDSQQFLGPMLILQSACPQALATVWAAC
jgi:hypothetical protein